MSPETKRSQLGPPVHDSSRMSSPDELRRRAKRLRMLAEFLASKGWENNRASCLQGAEANERLADVIDWLEENRPIQCSMYSEEGDDSGVILRIARGETNERGSDGPADRA